MAKINLYDIKGAEVKSMDLPDTIFNAPAAPSLIAQAVRVYSANQRGGNASTKTRGEVTGSTRKIYRQKGTGRARHGANKAPIFVGGGIVGGPRPKDYSLGISKNMKQKAFFGVLTAKAKNKAIVGLEEKDLTKAGKTKVVFEFLKKLGMDDMKVTVVFAKMENNQFTKAVRNIEGVELSDAVSLNTYQVLKSKKIVFLETAIDALKKHYKV